MRGDPCPLGTCSQLPHPQRALQQNRRCAPLANLTMPSRARAQSFTTKVGAHGIDHLLTPGGWRELAVAGANARVTSQCRLGIRYRRAEGQTFERDYVIRSPKIWRVATLCPTFQDWIAIHVVTTHSLVPSRTFSREGTSRQRRCVGASFGGGLHGKMRGVRRRGKMDAQSQGHLPQMERRIRRLHQHPTRLIDQ